MTEDGLISTKRAALLAGASYRQVDYWCRIGLITPVVDSFGSGSHRRWSPKQVPQIAALAAASALAGGRCSDLLRTISEQPGPIWRIRVGRARITIHIDKEAS